MSLTQEERTGREEPQTAEFHRQAEHYWWPAVVFSLVKPLPFEGMRFIFLLPFPSPFTSPHLPLWWRAMQKKWKQIKEKNWTLIFFFVTQLLMVLSGFSFFTPHPPFSSTSYVSSCSLPRGTIVSVFVVLIFDGVSEGPCYSSRRIKCLKLRNWLCFLFLSEPCSVWPVPDDQKSRRRSQYPRCTGDRVQIWSVEPGFVCLFFNLHHFADAKDYNDIDQ